ncbi:DUF262 domain-containing protein [Amycolatopsis sp. NPDC021455]|uniref:DUF262 domain-containing protein n=1 Tax=Amycolatopsis sp. NPDC021455 TaxID=3154901 RepID=UPI0033F09252
MAVSKQDIVKRFEDAQNALVLQASDLSLETIAAMVQKESIDVAPLFQRRERWDVFRQSSLIESFLMNIPVPPVYLAEQQFGKYSVIDGKQRITAIHDFMRNRYALSSLERFTELEGLKYSHLPDELRNALEVRPYIRAITILRQSDEVTKFEVFHRLNSGGQPLNAQEVRNVIFRGPLNDLIVQLSSQPFLKLQLKIRDEKSSSYRDMTDVEFVLRFLTLREQWENFSGDFRRSMDRFMAMHQKADAKRIDEYSASFLRSLKICQSIWGPHAFKRPDRGTWRDQALAGMYDAQMVAVDSLNETEAESVLARSDKVVRATRDLFADPEFEASVRVATNTPARVKLRIARMTDLLKAHAK